MTLAGPVQQYQIVYSYVYLVSCDIKVELIEHVQESCASVSLRCWW